MNVGGSNIEVLLEEMGQDSMRVIPIYQYLMLIFALKDPVSKLRVYFKHVESNMPRFFAYLIKESLKQIARFRSTLWYSV